MEGFPQIGVDNFLVVCHHIRCTFGDQITSIENGNAISNPKYRLDKIVQTTTYTYNAAGDLLEIYEQGQDAVRYLKRGFVYDGSGRLSEIRWRRNSKEEFNRMVYAYDQKGICSTVETFYPATEYRVLTKYIYAFY